MIPFKNITNFLPRKSTAFLLLSFIFILSNYSAKAQAGPQTIEAVILFDSGAEQPTSASWTNAKEQVTGLDKNIRIRLKGYTDSIGSEEQNLALSQNRAEAVKVLLVALGFDAESITVSAKGEAEPSSDNATEAGRAENRRVILSIR
jgi:OOP family OmpA-OmpF porin